jgi:hypothetical protein
MKLVSFVWYVLIVLTDQALYVSIGHPAREYQKTESVQLQAVQINPSFQETYFVY